MARQNEHTQDRITVIGICGSLRPGSYTQKTVNIALQGAQETGAHTKRIDLNQYHLPFCDGRDDHKTYPNDVLQLRKDVRVAHGIILGTPVYHGGLSGVLKNALDLMGFAEFEGRMIGLVGVAGGQMGALHALNSLRAVGRTLHAWVIPEQVSIPTVWKQFDNAGNLKDKGLEERVKEVGRQVARFAYLHSSERSMEFLRNWEEAFVNPGGG